MLVQSGWFELGQLLSLVFVFSNALVRYSYHILHHPKHKDRTATVVALSTLGVDLSVKLTAHFARMG